MLQAFSEGKIDFMKPRAALGDVVDTQPERYSQTIAEMGQDEKNKISLRKAAFF